MWFAVGAASLKSGEHVSFSNDPDFRTRACRTVAEFNREFPSRRLALQEPEQRRIVEAEQNRYTSQEQPRRQEQQDSPQGGMVWKP